MTDCQRIAAIVLMLLSQVTGGIAVICDEGLGRQVMELFPEACCGPVADDGLNSPSVGLAENPCGPCRDLPLTLLLQREDEDHGSIDFSYLSAAALPATPLTWLVDLGTTAGVTTPAAPCSTTVSQFTRTVVLHC